MILRRTALMLFAMTATTTLFAHDGHGRTEGSSILHYLSEPYHAIALFLGVASIAGALLIVRRRRTARRAAAETTTRS